MEGKCVCFGDRIYFTVVRTHAYVPSGFVKYNIGLKTLLQQGISEPIFYVDLVYKFEELLENLILVINLKR